jgi:desulfoferrodoxin-like iron-binding protein
MDRETEILTNEGGNQNGRNSKRGYTLWIVLWRSSYYFHRKLTGCQTAEHPLFRNNAIKGRGISVKNRGCVMVVEYCGEVYECKICDNKVEVIEVGGGALMCCGKEMKNIKDKPETTVNLPDYGGG